MTTFMKPKRLDDVAGVARGFPFEPAGAESRSGVDAAAEATKQEPRWAQGPTWAKAIMRHGAHDPR